MRTPSSSLPPTPSNPVKVWESGAKRDDAYREVAYHLLCPSAIREYARTAKVGAVHYGERNWEAGLPTGNYIDHALEHLLTSMQCGEPKMRLEHLGHALWNIAAVIHNETGCSHHTWPMGKDFVND